MIDYKSLINFDNFKSKTIKLQNVTSVSIIKEKELMLSYLAYKFLTLQHSEFLNISSIIHKPEEVINDQSPEIYISPRITIKLYNSNNIYSVIYFNQVDNKAITSNVLTSVIIASYELFSTLFVTCNVRFISRNPMYAAFVSPHSPDIVTSIISIFDRYGICDDKLFNRRLNRIFSNKGESNVSDNTNIEAKN